MTFGNSKARLQLLRSVLLCLVSPRTEQARRIRLEAVRYVLSGSSESISTAAKRLGVSREHFSKNISQVRNFTLLPEKTRVLHAVPLRETSHLADIRSVAP